VRFRSQIGQQLNALGLTGEGVEIGVHTGQFAEQILQHWKGHRLWLVDPWRHLDDYLDSFNTSNKRMERRLKLAQRRLKRFDKRVGWIRERSEIAVKCFKPESCDFIYIDANHSYEHVRIDLSLWYPKVRPGGIVAGHDYYDAVADEALEPVMIYKKVLPSTLTSYGVKSAVDEFANDLGVTIHKTAEKYPTWYFLKPR
jgi:hypothetical protein